MSSECQFLDLILDHGTAESVLSLTYGLELRYEEDRPNEISERISNQI